MVAQQHRRWRARLTYNPDNPVGVASLRAFEMVAGPLAVQPINLPIHDLADIERAIASLAEQPNGGVLFPPTLPFSRFERRCRPFWHATASPQSPYIRRLRQPEDWSPTARIELQYFANP